MNKSFIKDERVTIADRLRQIMDDRSLKQVDIVRICQPYASKYKTKIGRNDISQYVSGKVEPGQTKLFVLANALGVNEAWLMGFDVPMQKQEERKVKPDTLYLLDNKKIRMIPLFESVSAGFGVTAAECVIDYVPCFIESDAEAEETLCLTVHGDSMFPKIEDGDVIQVRKQTSIDSGSVAVVLLDKTEGLVKKVTYADNWIELHSFNPMYPVQRFEGKDVLRISVVGLVKKVIKNI